MVLKVGRRRKEEQERTRKQKTPIMNPTNIIANDQ